MDKRIVVPEGMLKVANAAWFACEYEKLDAMRDALEAALKWLSENPIVPTDANVSELFAEFPPHQFVKTHGFHQICIHWQRIMFLAPEPVVPEEVKDLLWNQGSDDTISIAAKHDMSIIEAFSRGLRKADNR